MSAIIVAVGKVLWVMVSVLIALILVGELGLYTRR